MVNRKSRANIARETLEIVERGWYMAPSGKEVRIDDVLECARSQSVLYSPEMFGDLTAQRDAALKSRQRFTTKFEVVNATTLQLARDRIEQESDADYACLNFASAKNPGGGFLGGSQAQEESLARSSGLHACISPMQQMYETNRACGTSLYTDHMIYSPRVPVFRDDDGGLLESPYLVSILTVPAVNAGAVRKNEPQSVDRIAPTMSRRMEFLLSIASAHQHSRLILGAWGCGVFKNDSAQVAQWFHNHLVANPKFDGLFDTVVFAITDWSDERRFIGPFERQFADE